MYVCIFLQQYRIHIGIGNSKNYLGICSQANASLIQIPTSDLCCIRQFALIHCSYVTFYVHATNTQTTNQILVIE